MFKVLKRVNDRLFSPYRRMEYEPGVKYVCEYFDTDATKDCSRGFYATEIDGIIYSFRNLPGYEVWECEVGGKKVEIDQFKRRYETIRLIRLVPHDEVRRLAEAVEPQVGYKLAEALFPVNPLKIQRNETKPTNEEIALLRKWASVGYSVRDSVLDSVRASVRDSVGYSVWYSVLDSVLDSVWYSVRASVRDSVLDSVWYSVRASVWVYISSLFPGIVKWEYIDHPEGVNPYQPCIDLWHRGLIPSYDGKTWRLHAGEKAAVVWEGTL